jgi:LCP family protein required for cell wall assembly
MVSGGVPVSVDTQFGVGGFRPPSPINVYTARRPHKRWTFWRILRWTLAVVLMSGVTIGGAVAYYVWNRLERITTTSDPNLKAADQQLARVVDPATQPAVALVLGYDKRYGSGNARGHSDTLMLIRVDPRTHVLSLLSLPRDLYVPVPGLGTRKINDAYAYGGAPLAIKTVSQVLGVKINYYVPVNFHLFRKTVDVFHGVYLDVDRRYYHANNSSGNYAEIDLKPGYQKLSGFQALQYVRYRHLDSDFIRTARQQAFVREFKRRLDVWSAGANLFDLLDSLPNDLKVRGSAKGQSVGPRTILSYVKLLAEIPRGKMVQVRLVGDTPMINGASVVTASPEAIRAAVTEFQNPNPAISQAVASRFGGTVVGGAKRTATKKRIGPKPIPPARLRVVTVNGSGVQGVATVAKVELQKAGWPHTGVAGNLPDQSLFSTSVYYTSPRAHASAERLRRSLGDTNTAARLPAALSDFGLGADVVVALGKAFSGVTPPPKVVARLAAPPPSRPLVEAAASFDAGNFFVLQKKLGYKLLYPSKVPVGSQYGEAIETGENPYRMYRLGKHGKFLSVDARTAFDSSHAWGLRYTLWTDAPILEQPSRQVCWDKKRQVRIYTNGTAIHRIAVFYGGEPCKASGGVVVWIDNSLDDKLSPETMIAIAKSLMPARRAPA